MANQGQIKGSFFRLSIMLLIPLGTNDDDNDTELSSLSF